MKASLSPIVPNKQPSLRPKPATMAEINGTTSDADPQPTPDQPDASLQPAVDPRNPNLPLTSPLDTGLSKRPRDARLLHMILANYGISAYQERVPLQLMDFAYRYTSSTLQDALHFTSENYGTNTTTGGGTGTGRGAAAHGDLSGITLSSLRLSIASRTHYQFNPALPKEFYMELAAERNRVVLPGMSREWGVRLPPEGYVLTGQGWEMKEEFDEVMVDSGEDLEGEVGVGFKGMDDEGGDEEEGGRMEDIFGTGAGESGLREMEDE